MATETEKFPARLHVIIARNASTAIVFRRGPSKHVCTMLWNMNNDEFSLGQWLKGRIYERRSDISPDGKEIAFVARGEVFVTSVDGSLTKRLTNTPEQERFVKFTSDGKAVAYCSERDGKWHTYQTKKLREEEPFFFASTLLNEEPLITNGSDNYLPEFSPDGKQVAYIEDRRTLKVMNLETKATVTLLTPDDFYHFRD